MRLAKVTLAVAIGLIIDDTVVVVENIARHLEKKELKTAPVAVSGLNGPTTQPPNHPTTQPLDPIDAASGDDLRSYGAAGIVGAGLGPERQRDGLSLATEGIERFDDLPEVDRRRACIACLPRDLQALVEAGDACVAYGRHQDC